MAFTTVTHFEDIHTLAQLDARGLQIGAASGSLRKVFGSMENVFGWRNMSSPTVKSLQDKYVIINSMRPALDRVANDGDICCIERLTDVKVILSVSIVWSRFRSRLFVLRFPNNYTNVQYKYRTNDGSSPVHIIEECIRSFYLAYIVKKGSALQPSFSHHVQHLFEGGWFANKIPYS